jgi:hypothetical protein
MPSSVLPVDHHGYDQPTIVGNFLACLTPKMQHESAISWFELGGPGGAVVQMKTIPLKKIWRVQVSLRYLEMNQDGVLLLNIF